MRKVLTFVATASLSLSVMLAGPATAFAAAGGTCVESPGSYHIGGKGSTTYNESIQATIDPYSGYFTNCGAWDPNDFHGQGWSAVAGWVALEAPGGNIVQLGPIECDNGNDNQKSWCDATQYPSVIMAYQGCSGLLGEVHLDFGNIGDFAAHTYKLSVNRTLSRVEAYFDGSLMGYASFSDNRLSCWITNSAVFPEVFAERRNRGDAVGLSSQFPLKFSSMFIGSGANPNVVFWPNCDVVEPSSGTGKGFCLSQGPALPTLKAWSVY
jgi:hypothetical protein